MNIEKLFSTKERVKILNNIIYLEKEFGVNETAKKTRLSKGLVSKYFEILVKEGVLRRRKNRLVAGNNSRVKSIKIMLNIQGINTEIFKRYNFVKAVGLYGSCAKGTNTESSDVDLWIKADKAKELPKLTSELRNRIENAKILVLDDEKIEMLKSKDPLFYYSLHFGSIVLYGNENEI